MPALKTAETAQPLNEAERQTLETLLARASQGAPGVRIGKPYIALVNLSVPRRVLRGADGKEPDNATELAKPGDTVYLTDDEAAKFMRHGARDGRKVAVIRPATGPEASQELSRPLPPLAVSGRLNGPPADARPDPVGSSAIQVAQPMIPELAEPVPGQENSDGDAGPGSGQVNAEDIIPNRVRQRQTAQTRG